MKSKFLAFSLARPDSSTSEVSAANPTINCESFAEELKSARISSFAIRSIELNSFFLIFSADEKAGFASATAADITNTSQSGIFFFSTECICSAVSTRIVSMPATSEIFELARTKETSAPLFRASTAMATPCFPELRFPMNRTGSIDSRVPPAEIRNFLPSKSCSEPI
ncbi:unannotated protein [freshwater metagenome]|uniref:Unannotated protein n=1 Tax=freshwater metagenome TaxID=449393 RepID=A0A6J7GWX5_9ZZZZ